MAIIFMGLGLSQIHATRPTKMVLFASNVEVFPYSRVLGKAESKS